MYRVFAVEFDEREREWDVKRRRRLRIGSSLTRLERCLETNPVSRSFSSEQLHCVRAEYCIQQPLELRVNSLVTHSDTLYNTLSRD